MTQHADFVQCAVSGTPGTGAITLGAATTGNRTFSTAFGADATVDILLIDGSDQGTELGAVYNHGTGTITRGTHSASTTGSQLSLSPSATVAVAGIAAAANAAETVLTHADRSASYGFFVRSDGSTQQTVSDAGWRVLHGGTGGALQTVEWNVGSVWSADANGRATLPEGRWLVGGCAGVDDLTTAQRLLVGLQKNGEATPSRLLSRSGAPNATATVALSGSTLVESDGDDYFCLVQYTDGAGTHLTLGTAGYIYFWAQYLGPIL